MLVLNESILNEQFIVGNALKRYVSSSVFKNGLRNDISCSRGIYLTLQYFTLEFCCFVNLQNISRFDSYYYDKFNIETDLYDIDFRLPLKCNSHTKFDFENSILKNRLLLWLLIIFCSKHFYGQQNVSNSWKLHSRRGKCLKTHYFPFVAQICCI